MLCYISLSTMSNSHAQIPMYPTGSNHYQSDVCRVWHTPSREFTFLAKNNNTHAKKYNL